VTEFRDQAFPTRAVCEAVRREADATMERTGDWIAEWSECVPES
jgi:hypothetical protein